MILKRWVSRYRLRKMSDIDVAQEAVSIRYRDPRADELMREIDARPRFLENPARRR